LLQEFNFKDKLKYFRNEVQLGSPENWNSAIRKAEGEYIKILHCDDFFASRDSLAKYVELLDKNPDAGFGFSATDVFHVEENEHEIYTCSSKHFLRIQKEPEFLFFKNVIGGPSATIHRRKISLEYDKNVKWVVDIDFYIRVLKKGYKMVYSPEPLICTSDGADGQITQAVMNDKNIQIREHIILYAKLLDGNPEIERNKFLLYFKILFYSYKVNSIEEVNGIYAISEKLIPFFDDVFKSLHKHMLWTRIKIKLYNSALNKKLFKREVY